MSDPLRAAAEGMVEAYGEHLNHHCQRCTKAWEKLRDALEAAPAAAPAKPDQVTTRANVRMPSSAGSLPE